MLYQPRFWSKFCEDYFSKVTYDTIYQASTIVAKEAKESGFYGHFTYLTVRDAAFLMADWDCDIDEALEEACYTRG